MHARILLVVAALALPNLAAPVASKDHVVPREPSSVESRSDISVVRRIQDLFRRVPIIGALPEASTYDVFVKSRSEDSTSADDSDDETDLSKASDALEERGIRGHGANPRGIRGRDAETAAMDNTIEARARYRGNSGRDAEPVAAGDTIEARARYRGNSGRDAEPVAADHTVEAI